MDDDPDVTVDTMTVTAKGFSFMPEISVPTAKSPTPLDIFTVSSMPKGAKTVKDFHYDKARGKATLEYDLVNAPTSASWVGMLICLKKAFNLAQKKSLVLGVNRTGKNGSSAAEYIKVELIDSKDHKVVFHVTANGPIEITDALVEKAEVTDFNPADIRYISIVVDDNQAKQGVVTWTSKRSGAMAVGARSEMRSVEKASLWRKAPRNLMLGFAMWASSCVGQSFVTTGNPRLSLEGSAAVGAGQSTISRSLARATEQPIFQSGDWTVIGASDTGPEARSIQTPYGNFTELKIVYQDPSNQLFSVKGNGFIRGVLPAGYQGPSGEKVGWGTSFVGPGYWSRGVYYHNPRITQAVFETLEDGTIVLKGTLEDEKGNFQATDLQVIFRRPSASLDKVEMEISFTLRALKTFPIDRDRNKKHEGFKVLQFSSMNTPSAHDADFMIYWTQRGKMVRRSVAGPMNRFIVRRPQLMGDAPVYLANENPTSWWGYKPSTSIQMLSDSYPGDFMPQAWLTESFDPGDDNLGAWISFDSAKNIYRRGTTITRVHAVLGVTRPWLPLVASSSLPRSEARVTGMVERPAKRSWLGSVAFVAFSLAAAVMPALADRSFLGEQAAGFAAARGVVMPVIKTPTPNAVLTDLMDARVGPMGPEGYDTAKVTQTGPNAASLIYNLSKIPAKVRWAGMLISFVQAFNIQAQDLVIEAMRTGKLSYYKLELKDAGNKKVTFRVEAKGRITVTLAMVQDAIKKEKVKGFRADQIMFMSLVVDDSKATTGTLTLMTEGLFYSAEVPGTPYNQAAITALPGLPIVRGDHGSIAGVPDSSHITVNQTGSTLFNVASTVPTSGNFTYSSVRWGYFNPEGVFLGTIAYLGSSVTFALNGTPGARLKVEFVNTSNVARTFQLVLAAGQQNYTFNLGDFTEPMAFINVVSDEVGTTNYTVESEGLKYPSMRAGAVVASGQVEGKGPRVDQRRRFPKPPRDLTKEYRGGRSEARTKWGGAKYLEPIRGEHSLDFFPKKRGFSIEDIAVQPLYGGPRRIYQGEDYRIFAPTGGEIDTGYRVGQNAEQDMRAVARQMNLVKGDISYLRAGVRHLEENQRAGTILSRQELDRLTDLKSELTKRLKTLASLKQREQANRSEVRASKEEAGSVLEEVEDLYQQIDIAREVQVVETAKTPLPRRNFLAMGLQGLAAVAAAALVGPSLVTAASRRGGRVPVIKTKTTDPLTDLGGVTIGPMGPKGTNTATVTQTGTGSASLNYDLRKAKGKKRWAGALIIFSNPFDLTAQDLVIEATDKKSKYYKLVLENENNTKVTVRVEVDGRIKVTDEIVRTAGVKNFDPSRIKYVSVVVDDPKVTVGALQLTTGGLIYTPEITETTTDPLTDLGGAAVGPMGPDGYKTAEVTQMGSNLANLNYNLSGVPKEVRWAGMLLSLTTPFNLAAQDLVIEAVDSQSSYYKLVLENEGGIKVTVRVKVDGRIKVTNALVQTAQVAGFDPTRIKYLSVVVDDPGVTAGTLQLTTEGLAHPLEITETTGDPLTNMEGIVSQLVMLKPAAANTATKLTMVAPWTAKLEYNLAEGTGEDRWAGMQWVTFPSVFFDLTARDLVVAAVDNQASYYKLELENEGGAKVTIHVRVNGPIKVTNALVQSAGVPGFDASRIKHIQFIADDLNVTTGALVVTLGPGVFTRSEVRTTKKDTASPDYDLSKRTGTETKRWAEMSVNITEALTALGLSFPLVEKARLGFDPNAIKQVEGSVGSSKGNALIAALAGKIIRERVAVAELAEELRVLALATEVTVAGFAAKVKEILKIQDAPGLMAEVYRAGDGVDEKNDLMTRRAVLAANSLQQMVLFWISDNPKKIEADKIQAGRIVAREIAWAKAQGLDFDGRFQIHVTTSRGLTEAIKNIANQMRQSVKGADVKVANPAAMMVLAGTTDLLDLVQKTDSVPAHLLERKDYRENPVLRRVAPVAIATLSQEVLTHGELLSDRTVNMLEKQGNGRYSLNESWLSGLVAQLTAAVEAMRATQRAA